MLANINECDECGGTYYPNDGHSCYEYKKWQKAESALATKTRELEVANSFLNKAMRVIRNLDIDGVFLGAFDVCGDKENEQVEVDDLIEEFLAYKEQKDER